MANELPSRNFGRRKTDQRIAERERVFAAGLVVHNGASDGRNCLIRDLSATGAQIRANAAQPVPKESYLLNLANRSAYQARFVWRRGSLTGLRFDGQYVINNVLPVHLEYLRRLFIAAKLRQIDLFLSQAIPVTEALSKSGVSHESYARWRSTHEH